MKWRGDWSGFGKIICQKFGKMTRRGKRDERLGGLPIRRGGKCGDWCSYGDSCVTATSVIGCEGYFLLVRWIFLCIIPIRI